MKRLLRVGALVLLFMVAGCAHQDDWTRHDTMGQIGVTAVMLVDAVLTEQIQDYSNVYEAGPLASRVLGPQPNTSDTYQYFATLMISNYFITRALPAKWRPYWQSYEMGVHSYAIINTCRQGVCSDRKIK